MYIEFWVEEPSMEAFLLTVLPGLFGEQATYGIRDFGDKQTLLGEAPRLLRAYAKWMPDDWRIVILVDEDRQDCRALKAQLEGAASEAGLRTRSVDPKRFQVLNRIVVEELEAWLLGDAEALREAYPRLPDTFESQQTYRDPDAVGGGTWEALERLLQRAGHLQGRLRKQETAREMARRMVLKRNRAPSFQAFWGALAEMVK